MPEFLVVTGDRVNVSYPRQDGTHSHSIVPGGFDVMS
jgi:hypothetical protein